MPLDAGNLDSPSSQTPIRDKKATENGDSSKGKNTAKVLVAASSSKDELGWSKGPAKPQNEDEKHDEERSLLDPDNEDELYSKDPPKTPSDKKEMRRVSTKPDKPVLDSASNSKKSESEESEEETIIKGPSE